jgi:lysyl-tRNA synthetase class II
MTKITIDEVEYDTEDFTELQNQIVQEIMYNNNVQTQLNYQSNSLRVSLDLLTAKLKQSLETETPEESE